MLDGFYQLLMFGGLPLLFLLVLLEGNPLIGSFIPGQVLVIFVGFLIGTTGFMNLYWTIFFVFLGAFLGDLIGYFIGSKYGLKIVKFGLDEKSLIYKSSKKFFQKFGAWSIILGREFNLTRAFMPFFAGVFKMPKIKFSIFAFFSNVIWAILAIYLGYYFGIAIVSKISFLFWVITILIIYFIFIRVVYSSFNSFYVQNKILHKYYGLKNILSIGVTLIFLIILLFYGKWENIQRFNEYFNFIFFPSLYFFANFIYSKLFIFFVLGIIFMVLIFKQNIKLIIIFLWGGVISLFIIFLSNLLLKNIFEISNYVYIIFLTLIIFYYYILIIKYVINKKIVKYLEFFMISFLVFAFLAKYSQTGNLYLVIVSFFIGTVCCDFLIILSHYQILDDSLALLINKE